MNREKLAEMITRYEEKRYKAYPDSKGILTVGIGCNLEESRAPLRIAALGVDHEQLCKGECELNDAHVMTLFWEDMDIAINDAVGLVPNFWDHPDDVQHVIADMVFNMGRPRFSKFKKAIAALKEKDYRRAAAEMTASKWYEQVGRRAKENVALVLKHAV